MAGFTQDQLDQIFGLSMVSNHFTMADYNTSTSGQANPPTDQTAAFDIMTKLINTYVNPAAQDGAVWQIVYGPVASADPKNPDTARNVLFVALNTTTNSDYVVATSGTTGGSPFDLFDEDVDHSPGTFEVGADSFEISNGTINGLNVLLGLTDSNGNYLIGNPAQNNGFLPRITDGKINVTFTGHSLGGALCPALALTASYLRDQTGMFSVPGSNNQPDSQTEGNWDPDLNATIRFLETAGPAVGGSDYISRFSADNENINGVAIWNALDVVPHAWNNLQNDGGNIIEIYAKPGADCKDGHSYEPSGLVLDGVNKAISHQVNSYAQFNPVPAINGPFQCIVLPRGCIIPDENIYYLSEMLFQHLNAYAGYFNTQDLLDAVIGPDGYLFMACKLLQKFAPDVVCDCVKPKN